MKFILSIVLAGLLSFKAVSAQVNLVPNNSFEQYDTCPQNISKVHYATGWWEVNKTPDYFNSCSTQPWWISYDVPKNGFGYQNGYDGSAYIGIATYDFTSNYREIIGCALLDSLVTGSLYKVSMRVSRAEEWPMASNNIGILFSNKIYNASNTAPIENSPSVWSSGIVTDTAEWVLLEWDYIPDSSYRYAYVGNFFDDAHTDTAMYFPQISHTYYFIDDIQVLCPPTNCKSPENMVSVHYNDENKTLEFEGNLTKLARVEMFDMLGKMVLRKNPISTVDVSLLPTATYVVALDFHNKVERHKLFIH
jgi:hypothetical protein